MKKGCCYSGWNTTLSSRALSDCCSFLRVHCCRCCLFPFAFPGQEGVVFVVFREEHERGVKPSCRLECCFLLCIS